MECIPPGSVSSEATLPSAQILKRKLAAEEAQQRRRSLRQKGRRVSFAPDEELETMHLYPVQVCRQAGSFALGCAEFLSQECILQDKGSPVLSQEAQPFSEQNLNRQQEPSFNPWPAKQTHAYGGEGSPMLSPMSMELTNDTLQQAGGMPFLGAAGNDTDSFSFHGFNQTKEGTHNITDNVPGLSTLVEEDEEAFAAAARDSSYQEDDEMELTGATGPQAAGTVLSY